MAVVVVGSKLVVTVGGGGDDTTCATANARAHVVMRLDSTLADSIAPITRRLSSLLVDARRRSSTLVDYDNRRTRKKICRLAACDLSK